MSAYSETVNVIMKSRVRESRTHGSVRGWHREVPVYSTAEVIYIMNIGFWSCIILVIPFAVIGVLFAIFKEKAAKFVSGFNSFSKEEQALYNKAHISRDIRNQCFIWTAIMLAGALLSYFLTSYMAIPTYIIWLVLFFREVHLDNHKAFEKYLLK